MKLEVLLILHGMLRSFGEMFNADSNSIYYTKSLKKLEAKLDLFTDHNTPLNWNFFRRNLGKSGSHEEFSYLKMYIYEENASLFDQTQHRVSLEITREHIKISNSVNPHNEPIIISHPDTLEDCEQIIQKFINEVDKFADSINKK